VVALALVTLTVAEALNPGGFRLEDYRNRRWFQRSWARLLPEQLDYLCSVKKIGVCSTTEGVGALTSTIA
jgi:hypothetical protein